MFTTKTNKIELINRLATEIEYFTKTNNQLQVKTKWRVAEEFGVVEDVKKQLTK